MDKIKYVTLKEIGIDLDDPKQEKKFMRRFHRYVKVNEEYEEEVFDKFYRRESFFSYGT